MLMMKFATPLCDPSKRTMGDITQNITIALALTDELPLFSVSLS